MTKTDDLKLIVIFKVFYFSILVIRICFEIRASHFEFIFDNSRQKHCF